MPSSPRPGSRALPMTDNRVFAMPVRPLRAAAMLSFCLAAPAVAQDSFVVTSTANAGEGSLRAALAAASGRDAPATIVIFAEGEIAITETLSYSGTGPLTMFGNATRIHTDRNLTLFESTRGADLYIRNVLFEGPGGFGLQAPGDNDAAAGSGIAVRLRGDQSGTALVELQNVRVLGVAGHGVHVSDCLQPGCDTEEGPGGGAPASIELRLDAVEILETGHGTADADGVRVEERGDGDIRLTASNTRVADVGGDGVELDEGQQGDVTLRVIGSAFENNGLYCDPGLLAGYLPEEPRREFASGVFSRSSVPEAVTGSPDDSCFTREMVLHDNGSVASYDLSVAVEGGFAVNEAGPGNVQAVMERTGIIGNAGAGLALEEAGEGGIGATLVGTFARDNTGDACTLSEHGPGDVTASLVGAVAEGNGGTGFVFGEEASGELRVAGYRLRSQFNDEGGTGIAAVQAGEGAGALTLTLSQIEDGIEAEGVEVTQD